VITVKKAPYPRRANDRLLRNAGVRRHRYAPAPEVRDVERCHDIMRITSVARRFLKPGVVVRAAIPFQEGGDQKVRPAVVVAVRGHDLVVIPLTSSPRATHAGDVAVHDLDSAGLCKPTRARTDRAVKIGASTAVEVLGRLGAADFHRIVLVRSAA
jgi:hypothetical protein